MLTKTYCFIIEEAHHVIDHIYYMGNSYSEFFVINEFVIKSFQCTQKILNKNEIKSKVFNFRGRQFIKLNASWENVPTDPNLQHILQTSTLTWSTKYNTSPPN